MKTKVLLAHNYYRSSEPSGEAHVLEAERAMLASNGHELREFFRFSDDILGEGLKGTIKAIFSTPWNLFAARAAEKAVDRFSPDVVHVHNTFPMISPAIFHSIGSRAARVLTLHNYRLFCPAAVPMRNGIVCTECLERHTVWSALKYGCYKNSRFATIPPAVNVALHRRLLTWVNEVDAFISLTEFQRNLMIEAGLPADLVHVKPNFYPGEPLVIPWVERRPSVVFVGRLTAEKGVKTLLQAWINWGPSAPELRIVGDGELKGLLMRLASAVPAAPIRFLGHLTGNNAQEEIARSCLLVLPSECFEGFPMVVREAFAFGTPVAASDIGPLPTIVRQGENGLLFRPGNADSLLKVIQSSWSTKGQLERLAMGARKSFQTLYTESVNYELLMDIYQQAILVSRRRKSA